MKKKTKFLKGTLNGCQNKFGPCGRVIASLYGTSKNICRVTTALIANMQPNARKIRDCIPAFMHVFILSQHRNANLHKL